MSASIDFARGGYGGDFVEEKYKDFTTKRMPYWWHFREVLRSSHAASSNWQLADGTVLPHDGQKELVATSLLHYGVNSNLADAISFHYDMVCLLNSDIHAGERLFRVRRAYKGLYSSLYSSFNSLCNIVCIVIDMKSPFGDKPGKMWNYTPSDAFKALKGITSLTDPLNRCSDRLEIRSHLDHYWLIWAAVGKGSFFVDENFTKGYVPVDPDKEVSPKTDAVAQSSGHVRDCAEDFNLIYEQMAVEHGYLDQYIANKGWRIDYSDYGPPHNGQRPKP